MAVKTLQRSKTLSNLQNEEKRLQHRRDMRKKMKSAKKRKELSQTQIHSANSLPVGKEIEFSSRNPVVSQYKNKLCLFMVEEMNEAYQALEQVSSLSGSEVGLSIDEDDYDTYDGTRQNFEAAESTIRSLFYQVSSKVPSHIKSQLRFTKDVYFYELISSQISTGLSTFVEHSLLEKCRALVSIDTFPSLFAMLFYRYADHFIDDTLLWNVFVKGVGQVFQHDMNQGTIRLTALYHSLKDIKGIKSKQKLMQLLMTFFFYYSSTNEKKMKHFLSKYDISLDEFILQNIKIIERKPTEAVSERYLERIAILKKLTEFENLNQQTVHKLNTVLKGFTNSGGLYNPSSKLKKQAQKTLDICFPQTRLAKRVVVGMLQLNFKGVALDLISTFSPFNLVET